MRAPVSRVTVLGKFHTIHQRTFQFEFQSGFQPQSYQTVPKPSSSRKRPVACRLERIHTVAACTTRTPSSARSPWSKIGPARPCPSSQSSRNRLFTKRSEKLRFVARFDRLGAAPMRHSTITTPYYHVYAPDGFESGHRSLEAAERAARRGAKKRRLEYSVYLTSVFGATGGGHGTLVYTALPPRR